MSDFKKYKYWDVDSFIDCFSQELLTKRKSCEELLNLRLCQLRLDFVHKKHTMRYDREFIPINERNDTLYQSLIFSIKKKRLKPIRDMIDQYHIYRTAIFTSYYQARTWCANSNNNRNKIKGLHRRFSYLGKRKYAQKLFNILRKKRFMGILLKNLSFRKKFFTKQSRGYDPYSRTMNRSIPVF